MYTLETLQSKTFRELKEIGQELNLSPAGDRRLRQTWIDAIAGVNPPLLALLEVSPVEPAQESPIIETVKTSPGVELEPVPEAPLESKFGRIVYPRPAQGAIATPKFKIGDLVKSKTLTWGLKKESLTGTVILMLPGGGVRVSFGGPCSGYGETFDYSQSKLEDLVQVQKPIVPINTFVNTPQAQEPIEVQVQGAIEQAAKTSPGVEVERVQEPIAEATKNSLGVEVDSVQDIINQTWTSWEKEYCAWLASAKWCIYQGENKRIDAFLPVSKTLRLEGMKKGTEYCAIWEVSQCTCDFSGLPLPVCSSLYVQEPIAQLAETSPGVEVERVQEPVIETVETSASGEVDRVQESIEVQAQEHKFLLCLKDGDNTLWYDGKDFVCEKWSAKTYCKRGVGAAKHQLRFHPEVKRAGTLQAVENSPADHKPIEVQATEAIEQAAETSPGGEFDRVQQPVIETVETSPGVEADREDAPECSHCFDDGFVEDESGLIKLCHCNSEPELSRQKAQSAIAPAAKNLPGSRSKTSTAHQLLELFKSSAQIIEDSPGAKTEATVSESAIAPAVKISIDADQHPILTGIFLSDRFVARYTPPQSDNIRFQVEADGQLSLVDFEVLTEPEPPDPDDFESLDAFREAIARWDSEHPSSFDHFSDPLPSSVQNEPPDPYEFDSMFAFWAAYDAWDEASDDASEPHSEPLETSLDSFCEWAPCPEDWYEPHLLQPSEVMELLRVNNSSDTSDFFIPTFDAWRDRPNRPNGSDEPPDTGIFARLPKPKPPNFPPQASQSKSAQVRLSQAGIPKLSRNYPETIPKPFHRVVAGSTQPARSPPGGDA